MKERRPGIKARPVATTACPHLSALNSHDSEKNHCPEQNASYYELFYTQMKHILIPYHAF